ncbi:SdpI family protein [Nonomuraea sp. ATR24]|uniref:SdpI family protein n=1 Tax=Nonomuraea sp. ATR24 TaxID=1676744 RepID=UPI0035C0E6E4
MEILPYVLAAGGLTVVVTGFLGLTERLPRNGAVGVRTPGTMRSEAAFRAANKAAGVPMLVAGGIGLAGGAAVWLMPSGQVTAAYVTIAGLLVMTVAGGVAGVRAAKAVDDGDARPSR